MKIKNIKNELYTRYFGVRRTRFTAGLSILPGGGFALVGPRNPTKKDWEALQEHRLEAGKMSLEERLRRVKEQGEGRQESPVHYWISKSMRAGNSVILFDGHTEDGTVTAIVFQGGVPVDRELAERALKFLESTSLLAAWGVKEPAAEAKAEAAALLRSATVPAPTKKLREHYPV